MRKAVTARLFLALVASGCMLLSTSPGQAASPSGCVFQLGFADLHALIPLIVGDCLDNEAYGANSDSLQHTTHGLLVWRKADNWTAFTDGYRTWVNGPYGLQERLNTERFPWEAGTTSGATLTLSDDGTTVQITVGQTINLTLLAPDGMSLWEVQAPDPNVLVPVPNPAATAVRGATLRSFRAVGVGQTSITATSHPICGPGLACPDYLRLYRVTIVVT